MNVKEIETWKKFFVEVIFYKSKSIFDIENQKHYGKAFGKFKEINNETTTLENKNGNTVIRNDHIVAVFPINKYNFKETEKNVDLIKNELNIK